MSRKLLIVGPAWVGDMVMAQTLFKLLKAQDGSTQIDVLAPLWTFPLLSRMAEVHEAIEMPVTHGELKLRVRFALAKRLQQRGYDQAIILPNAFKAALIPWLAKIPKRTGWRGEFRYGLLNDLRHLDKSRYPKMIARFMALGLPKQQPLPSSYPQPALTVVPDAAQAIAASLGLVMPTSVPVLALSPGAAFGSAKRWSAAHYAAVATQKLADGWQVWLFGSAADQSITANLNALTKNRCIDLAGRISLAETVDLLSLVTGLVTNDSGLMHVAAALNKPLVALYGPTSALFTPPLTHRAQLLSLKLPCQPCFKRECPLLHHQCMRDLAPAAVLAAIAAWEV